MRPWSLEALEGRALMATVGADYKLSGFTWANADRVTYSIAPDGVFWDHGANRLNAAFDGRFGAERWEREVARALATWQSVADVNIVLVGDSRIDQNAPGRAQGDPRFGDIRIGGYAFPGNTTTLAETYFPPPNGQTAAGDVIVNLGLNYNIGSDYDLYSVFLHETGHSLGLDHPTDPTEVLHARYGGARQGLSEGDIAGIRAIYGPRTPDPYRQSGQGSGFLNAIDLTGRLDGNGQAWLTGVSLSQVGDTTYYSVVAPAGSTGTFQATAMASGFSLLSPKVSVYDAGGRLMGSASDPSAWGNDVTVKAGGATAGQRYVVAVTGATSDVFAVGGYGVRVAFDGVSSPAAPKPVAPPTAPAVAPDRFEATGRPASLGSVTHATVDGLSLHSGSDVDAFTFSAATTGVYTVGAPGATVRVIDAAGKLIAQGSGQVSVRVNRSTSTIKVEVANPTATPLASYALRITSTPTTQATAPTTVTAAGWGRWTSWRAFAPRRQTAAATATPGQGSWASAWSFGRPPAVRLG